MPSAADLVSQGYNGYQGWSDAAAAADFASTKGAGKGGPTGGGSGGINFSFPDIKLDDVGGSAVEFGKGLDANVNNAFGQYSDYVKNLEDPLSIYGRLEGEAGVPQLRKTATSLSGQVNDLEDTIRRVEGDVSANSRNSLLTESQRRNLVTETKRPLTENLGWLGQSLGRVLQGIQLAGSDIATKTGLAVQGQDRKAEPLKMGIQLASESAARQMTGFTSDRQVRLDTLLAKIQSKQTLAVAEWQEANQLARDEKNFQFEKEKFAHTIASNTSVITSEGRQKLIDNTTGKVIADLGSTKAPGSGNVSDENGADFYLNTAKGANNASAWVSGSNSDWEDYTG